MNKKWFAGIFVSAFIFTFTGMGFADSIGDGGTCADSAGDGYEWCTARLHIGDNQSGGRDDYDFYWETYWKATDYNTAYFDYYYYTQTGMDSGNDDLYGLHAFYSSSGEKRVYSCTGYYVRSGCSADYHFSLSEAGSTGLIYAETVIEDMENGGSRQLMIAFKPTS
jgi:hypothetical protein